MNNFYLNRISVPITTGIPQPAKTQEPIRTEQSASFRELLEQQLQNNHEVAFSKHAVSRVVERNIPISESNLSRLNEGVRIAQEKGLDDTLILIDKTAFLVSAKNSKVITTVHPDDLKGNIFTNIDGTVII